MQIIATGSSSFDLANKVNEPLTGRSFEFTLYPLSLEEVRSQQDVSIEDIYNFMKLGMYPAVVGEKETLSKESLLKNITTNYLYKDIYMFEAIKKPLLFENLIKSLAYQIGCEVSVSELANHLRISRLIVEKYLKLLEQAYIIKRVRSYAKNGRNELKKSFKVYFIDLGIRNAIVGKTEGDLEKRDDRGLLFENLFFLELLKKGVEKVFPKEIYFWRTRDQKEIDFLWIEGDKIQAMECKWNEAEMQKFTTFKKLYPMASTQMVYPKDLLDEKFLEQK